MRWSSASPSICGMDVGRRSVWMRRARSISAATLSCAARSSSCSATDSASSWWKLSRSASNETFSFALFT